MRAVVIAPAFVSVAASETGFKVAQQPFLPDAHGFQDHFFPTGHGQDNVAGGGNGIGGICGSGLIDLLSVLRRTGRGSHILRAFDVEIEPVSRTVTQNGRPVQLAPREIDLLAVLVRNRGIALHRDVIYERVWGGESETDTRVLDLNIQRLRKKLGWGGRIRTVYRIGYMLEGAP